MKEREERKGRRAKERKERKKERQEGGMAGKRSGGGRTIFALLLHTVVSKGEGESQGWIRHDGFSVVRRHIGVRRHPMQALKYELAKWRIVIVNSVEEKKTTNV